MEAIHHLFFETRFGKAAVVFSELPFRLKEVCLPRPTRDDVIAHMKRFRHGVETSHPKAKTVAEMIDRYFNGQPCFIPWQWMDTAHWTPAQNEIYHVVAQIPFGQVRSYGEVARQAGRPKAARFVGNCMASNPFPVLVPCHRVIASNSHLGGFGGGLELKANMLKLEGVDIDIVSR